MKNEAPRKLAVICLSLSILLCTTVTADVVISMDRHAGIVGLPDETPGEVKLYGLVSNTENEQLDLTGRLDVEQPGSWFPASICIGVVCFPSETDFPVQLAPSAEDTFYVSFFPFQEAGKGVYHFTLVGQAEGDSARIELLAGGSSILVDDDDGENFETFVETALPDDPPFLTWDQSLEPLATNDIGLIERMLWLTGNATEDALSQQETDVLAAFFEAGGKAILSGQNILEGEAAADLGRDWLGAEVQSTSVESRHISGILGGLFGDIVSFDIAGGTGADNQISPDGLVTVGSGRAALEYDSGEIAAVGRIHIGGARMLVSGFGLEAVSEPEVLETLLEALLEWLDSLGSPDLPPIPSERLIAGLSPNPNFGILSLNLSVRSGSDVAVTLIDVAGRKVADLHEGEWFQEKLLLPQVSPGTYFIAVHSGEISEKRPLVVVGE